MQMTKKTTSVSTPELAVELSNFNFELKDYKEQKMLVMTFNWRNLEDNRTWKSFKYYGLLGDEERLNLKIFKCENELEDKWSLAVFGQNWLIKSAIAEWLITEEL